MGWPENSERKTLTTPAQETDAEAALPSASGAGAGRRRIHGRRMGRPLSPEQLQLLEKRLPELRLDLTAPPPADLQTLFDPPADDIWLEIGFGGGEHLLYQAATSPRAGIIGCEPFVGGVAKIVQGMDAAGLRNIRLHDDDAGHVLNWLPNASIGRVFILFPDPWPKRRHRKRRFLNAEGLAAIAAVMRPGAQLRFATDISDYATMVKAGAGRSPDFDLVSEFFGERPEDWPPTRYEEKASLAGRMSRFFIFERTAG